MKVNVKGEFKGYLFDDIECGVVFYEEGSPNHFLMRTDRDDCAAVDIETGVIYNYNSFNHGRAQYHIVEAEITIS